MGAGQLAFATGVVISSSTMEQGNGLYVSTNMYIVGNSTAARYYGIGSDLTALNASNISSGEIADARLSANVAKLDSAQVITGTKTFTSLVTVSSITSAGAGVTLSTHVFVMNGNVGIGTTSPTHRLDIAGDANTAGIHINSAVPNSEGYTLYNNAGTLRWNGSTLATGGSVTGTKGRIAIFSEVDSVGDSVMTGTLTNITVEGSSLTVQGIGGGDGLGVTGATSLTGTLHVTDAVTVDSALGVNTPKLRLADANVLITSATAANHGGVYVSTNMYIAGKYYGDGSSMTGISDNLGSHIATTTLNMNNKGIINAASISLVTGVDISSSAAGGMLISTAVYTPGLAITAYGEVQSTGTGVSGSMVGNSRGLAAVDLQVRRSAAAQVASGVQSVIGGGQFNTASNPSAVVGGGNQNTAGGDSATVSGGSGNTASGMYSVVPGGQSNTASGSGSFAAGYNAQSTADNAFTWSDSGNYLINNTADSVRFKAKGGFMVSGSTSTNMRGTVDRGMIITGNGLVGISTGAPQAALDVVATGKTTNDFAQIWRDSDGVAKATITAIGEIRAIKYYGDGSALTGAGGGIGLDAALLNGLGSTNYVRTSGSVAETVTGYKIFSSSLSVTDANGIYANSYNMGNGIAISSSSTLGVVVSSNVTVNGDVRATKLYGDGAGLTGLSVRTSVTRALPTLYNKSVEIGNFINMSGGVHSLYVTVSVSDNGFSMSKHYIIPVSYGMTGGNWNDVLPISNSGCSSSGGDCAEDFVLELNVNGATASLRLRRTEGSSTGNAVVGIEQLGSTLDAFTGTSATNQNSAAHELLLVTPLTQIDGNVGIGMANPTSKLHISTGTLTIDGTTANSIITSGNVGIATTNPDQKLTVHGNISTDGQIISSGVANNYFAGSIAVGTTTPTGLLNIASGATPSFVVAAGGKVGINTAVPTGDFNLQVAGNVGPAVTNSSKLGAVGMVWSEVNATTANVPTVNATTVNATTFNGNLVGNVAASSATFNTTTAAGLIVSSSAYLATAGGNVGVGTSDPTAFKLAVAGNVGPEANNTRDLGSSDKKWANVYATTVNATTFNGSFGTGGGGSITTGFTLGSVVFAGNGGVLLEDKEKLFWNDTSYRLGIGTKVPGSELDVRGSVAAGTNGTEFTVSAAGIVSAATSVLAPAFDTATGVAMNIGTGTQTALTLGRAGAATTVNGSGLTVGPTAWTATPTISGLISATSGLTATGAITANGALTANGIFTLGDNGETGEINTSSWDISTAGAVSGVTTLNLSGAITGATATDTINGVIINSRAVSNVTTLAMAGALSGVTSLGMGGALSGVTTLGMSGVLTNSATGATALTMSGAGAGISFTEASATEHKIVTGGNSSLVLSPGGTGNVGIGTTAAPAAKLQVVGGLQVGNGADFTVSAVGNVTASSVTATGDVTTTGSVYADIIQAKTVTTLNIGTGGNTNAVSIGKLANTTTINGSTALTVKGGTGSVGIGTDTPAVGAKLTVNGGNISTDGQVISSGTANNYMAGNLGIGVSNPTKKLEVSGTTAMTFDTSVAGYVTLNIGGNDAVRIWTTAKP